MISIKNLHFNYKKQKPLFADFSLEMETGQIVGLLGKNGAGKSSLLKIVAGLRTPHTGELIVNGFNPGKRDPHFLADLYMVPEDFTLPSITIGCYVNATAPLYPSFETDKLEKILSEFELEKNENLARLSHGQRKKFLIAFALASNCKLLLLDEPTNGLDIPSKSIFRKILVSSVSDEQLVLISTHQVKDIDAIIDKVVVIDEGVIVYQETMADISRKLNFETVVSLDGKDQVLYHEKCPMGYRVIIPANDGQESVIDMELLFNAIINKKI
ncbi:MAG: ABC transporter ATP-binding protein [Bacteroidales bacterium]|nr:ABC transporter ATP-binding protein [Bacteroidales bacterium]